MLSGWVGKDETKLRISRHKTFYGIESTEKNKKLTGWSGNVELWNYQGSFGIYRVFCKFRPLGNFKSLKTKIFRIRDLTSTSETTIKLLKTQKFKFPVFSRKSVFPRFTKNIRRFRFLKVMHNFRKFRIFWDLPDLKRMENDRTHSGTDGQMDRQIFCNLLLLIFLFLSLWLKKIWKIKSWAVEHLS